MSKNYQEACRRLKGRKYTPDKTVHKEKEHEAERGSMFNLEKDLGDHSFWTLSWPW
jgi:hypothetical protein